MTPQNIQAIIARLDAQAQALEKIEKRTEIIEGLQRETNGRINRMELWKARVEGAASVGRHPVPAAIASGVAVAVILTALHLS